jgi:hypothetical protein
VADGALPLTYEWRRNGVAIPGATEPVLTLARTQNSDEAFYSVVVSQRAWHRGEPRRRRCWCADAVSPAHISAHSAMAAHSRWSVRDDNSAVFLGFVPGAQVAFRQS